MSILLITTGSILISIVLITIVYESFFSPKFNKQHQLNALSNTCVSEIFMSNLNLRSDYYTEDEPDFTDLTNWWVNVSFDKCMENMINKEYKKDDQFYVKMYQRRASVLNKYFTTQNNCCYFSTDLMSFIINKNYDSKPLKELMLIFSDYYEHMLKTKVIKNVLVENLKLKESTNSTNISYNIAKREISRKGLLPIDMNVFSDNIGSIFDSDVIFHNEFKRYYAENKTNDDINLTGCYILYDTYTKKYHIGHATQVLSEINAILYSPDSNNTLQYDIQKGHKFLLRIVPFYMTQYKSLHKLEKDLMAAYKTQNSVTATKTLNDPLPLYSYDDATF